MKRVYSFKERRALTLDDGVRTWLLSVGKNTRRTYTYQLGLWLLFLEGRGISLRDATHEDAWDFVELYKQRKGTPSRVNPDDTTLADASVRNIITVLHSLYKHLSLYNAKIIDPWLPAMAKYKFARSGAKQQARAIPVGEIDRLRNAPSAITTDGVRDRALLDCLICCGMRVSEALNLDVGDVQEEDGILFLACRHTKTDELLIKVPPDDAAERIRHYLRLRLGANARPTDPFFVHHGRGRKLTPGRRLSFYSAQNMVKRYAEALGLPKGVTTHSGRVTLITSLCNAGVPLPEIMDITGQKSVNTVLRYVRREHNLANHPNRRVNFYKK